MASRRPARPTFDHRNPIITADGRVLVSRLGVAGADERSRDHIRKRIPAVACHVATRVVLLDMDDVERILATTTRRPWQRRNTYA